MGKGVVVVVVVLGTGDFRACREQIQNFPKREVVQSALPTPLPYCLLKNSNYSLVWIMDIPFFFE